MAQLTSLTVTATLLLAALVRGQDQAFPAPRNVCDALGVQSAEVQELILPPTNRQPFSMRLSLGGRQHVIQLEPHEIRSRDFRLLVDDGTRLREAPVPPSVTYRGEIPGDPSSAVAATVIDGQIRAELRIRGRTWAVQPASDIVTGLSPTTYVVYRRSDLLPLPFACATVGGAVESVPEMPVMAKATANATVNSVAELAIDADESYYRALGSSVNAVQNDVLGILNAMDVIYSRDLTIEHQVTAIIVRTVPTYSTNNPSQLLDQFRVRWISNHQNIRRDVAHLFTGRQRASSVIGIASVNSVCNNLRAYGLSFTLYTSNVTRRVALTAHELGHNWGARHCNGSFDCSIMCSSLGGCTSNLSGFGSVASLQITAFKNSLSCLTDSQPTQRPVLSDISPASVTSFEPEEVTITGSLLNSVTSVSVGGVVTGFTIVAEDTLRFTPPSSLGISTQQVTVSNGAGSSNIDLTIAGNHPSILEAPTFVYRGAPAVYTVHTDQNWQALLVISTSNQPSVLPGTISLGLGNNFTDMIVLPVFADANGTAEINLTFPTFITQVWTYWQAVTFGPNNLTLPIETSNLTRVVVF